MRKRIFILGLLSMGQFAALMILAASTAYADNCGSLSDCFHTGDSAASVITGVAVIITIAVLALPSLLEIPKSTSTPLEPDGVPQPPQPPTPESQGQMYQQPYPPAQYPELQPGHLSSGAVGAIPTHDKERPDMHPPERHEEHHSEGRPTAPLPEEPTVRTSGQPAQMQAPDHHPAQMQASDHHPEHRQAVEHHSEHRQAPDHHSEHKQAIEHHPEHRQAHPTPDEQSQMLHSDAQAQIARPDEQVSMPHTPLVQTPMTSLLYGIHHVTAIASHPQQNIDFYTGLLGLRLVKQTVNIDNPNTYHLYYGDELGRPGTILSFFAWPGAFGGNKGSGQAVAVAFSIPEDALNYWAEYLSRRGIRLVQEPTRFDEKTFSFYDPDGLQIDMVAHRDTGLYPTQSTGPIPPAYAIRGIHGVTLLEENYEHTHAFLTEVLSFRQVKAAENRIRYEVGGGGPRTFLDVLYFPGMPPGRVALGTIHHLAWRTPEDEQELILQQNLTRLGINLTQGIDPHYFPSYSFREPGGVLFEIAKLLPGFTIDEPPEQLGTHLILPPWLAHRRAELQQVLPPLRLPFTGGR